MHFLLLRVSSEELSRPQIDVFVLDRPYVELTRVDRDRLDGLLEGRSVVVGSNHACIIKRVPELPRRGTPL